MAEMDDIAAEKVERARKANEERNQKRLEMLEKIADGSDEAHSEEMEETADGNIVLKSTEPEKLEPEEEPKSEEQAQSEEASAEEEPAEQEASTEPDSDEVEHTSQDEKVINGVRYYLTVVNGKEKWLTLSQLRERAQKVESADEYLSTASELAKTASRAALSVEDEPARVEEEDDLEKTLSSAVLGDSEAIKKLASAFSELRKAAKARPSEVTPDVVQQIDNRLSFRSAVEWFEGEYEKELKDPFLKKLIFDRDAELAKAEPGMGYRQRMKRAGDEVREWIRNQQGVKAVPPKDKLDRKRAAHVNVPSASQRQPTQVEDEEDESVESVIEKMAKARGQNRAIVHKAPGSGRN